MWLIPPSLPLYSLSLYIDYALQHAAGVAQPTCNVLVAAEMAELEETVGHGLAVGIDVGYQVVLTFRTQDYLSVVLEKVHLKS